MKEISGSQIKSYSKIEEKSKELQQLIEDLIPMGATKTYLVSQIRYIPERVLKVFRNEEY